MVGNLDVSNSIAHLMVTNDLDTCIITTDNPFDASNKVDLEIGLYKRTDISIDVINGTPYISITIFPEGTVRSSGSSFNFIEDKNITTLENTTNDYLENLLKEYLYNISKKYNSDIAGFKALYKSEFFTRDEFEKIHWNDIFQDSFFEIKVNTRINSSNLYSKE